MADPRAEVNGYEIDSRPASAEAFVAAACDPARSVVVEACAGSGKTWLLVARALRLLLAGAEPAELLAITFTRKAAQEMQTRLMSLLKELALAPPDAARQLLKERGVREQDIDSLLPAARGLYERVLSSAQPLSVDTFHGWFSRLLKIAPLGSGVPHGYSLSETTGDLRAEAFRRFMHGLAQPGNDDTRQSLESLYELIGDNRAHALLECFVDKRAEWWAACGQGEPLAWLEDLCGDDGQRDARLTLWNDDSLMARVLKIALVLGKGAKRNQERATDIEMAVSADSSIEAFAKLLNQFCNDKGEPKGNYYTTAALIKSAEENFGANIEAFRSEFEEVAQHLLQLEQRSFEARVLETNRHLFAVGRAYLDVYQSLKAERRVLDFTDLEWHAYRLMSDGQHAAYLHGRLDARYRHILLDEFQDTNPLQWNVVRAWLDAYGGEADAPTLFVVGDPKQSIYRFRRADPRVFDAAQAMLGAMGASILRTNRTRRNAGAIVDGLNRAMEGNPRYSPQSTMAPSQGFAWRLPLADVEKRERKDGSFVLRDPLTVASEESEDERRLEEGRAVARALPAARMQLGAAWKDVMLLVKKRTHLAAYEAALREAGIPFVSDRRGGLLDSLEALDLIALLSFLVTPCNDLALAHVLKSPLMGASDDDLVMLAQRREPTWRERLRAVADAGHRDLHRASSLLERWIDDAAHLPVHDLLDRILHEGELQARYAQSLPPAARAQALGNIEAFIELALSLDGGRYPSLQKFIDALSRLRKEGQDDAPDEASIDAAADAVRILTVHGAKGLEARVVVLLDANHSEPARDDAGILCDWPQDEIAPKHFSAFGSRAERGLARNRMFDAEEALKTQEDWNLLYVAATRAKEVLIVSGVGSGKASAEDGVTANSWYARLLHLPLFDLQAMAAETAEWREDGFSLAVFSPPDMSSTAVAVEAGYSDARDEGILLHALLERLTGEGTWPVDVPDAASVALWLSCPEKTAHVVREHAARMLAQPSLEIFFHPQRYRRACNELDVMTEDGVVRFDRLVVFDHEVWILDYKRTLPEGERADYSRQLQRYRKAAVGVFPGKTIRCALIGADGSFVEVPQ